ncbi:coiled-coil domain-containing protein 28A-like isoform X4 [Centruroides sculpturatus]|uniref:coiled-coil domain-containing protein 28A-like isoform X4 n=1 Tax=Centruroides sculpturatus TaxID=218467 RepID=UPI000C6CC9D5|nr:coiled-coil domain-containing protein 28A-like isoform X4 [Centruroides sculpturatus]
MATDCCSEPAKAKDFPTLVIDKGKSSEGSEDEQQHPHSCPDTSLSTPAIPFSNSTVEFLNPSSEGFLSTSRSDQGQRKVSPDVEDPKVSKFDNKFTPRRVPRTNGKDITDVRQMEQGLLQLLDDFHSGKLQAFGKDCTFEKMENVREQQERLARLHFDLNAQQEIYGPQSDEGRRMAKENLSKLIENLQQLSMSIEQLQSGSPSVQTDV